MGGGGGYDFGVALSGSSSATSGLDQSLSRLFGDNIAGGSSKWLMPILIVSAAVVAIVWLLRR
jgi:hypothetical protein